MADMSLTYVEWVKPPRTDMEYHENSQNQEQEQPENPEKVEGPEKMEVLEEPEENKGEEEPYYVLTVNQAPLIPTGQIPNVALNPVNNMLDYFEVIHSVQNEEDLVTKDRADAFWIYFRLNNSQSLAVSPNVSHLSLTGEQSKYMQKPQILQFYTSNVEPIFVKLINSPNGRVCFLNKEELQFKCIIKNDKSFYRVTWLMPPQFEAYVFDRFKTHEALPESEKGQFPVLIIGLSYE
jgi:hypothetical protein